MISIQVFAFHLISEIWDGKDLIGCSKKMALDFCWRFYRHFLADSDGPFRLINESLSQAQGKANDAISNGDINQPIVMNGNPSVDFSECC